MRTCLLIVVVTCSCFVNGCNQNEEVAKKRDFYTIVISENDIEEDFDVSGVISDYHFIPLESNSESLISEVYKIENVDNEYIFKDKFVASTVASFSGNGRFLRKYGSKGKGAGEYVLPMGFTVDRQNKELIILNSEEHKINYYDLNSALFKRVKSYNFAAHDLALVDGGFAFSGAAKDFRIIFSDTTMKRSAGYILYTKRHALGLINSLYRYSDSLLVFRVSYNDTIFKVNKDAIEPYLVVDFGDKKFTNESFNQMNAVQQQRLQEYTSNYMTNIGTFAQNSNTFIISFAYGKKQYLAFIDRKTENKKIFPRGNSIDNVTYQPNFPAILGVDKDGYFLSVISSSKFLEAAKKIRAMNEGKNNKEAVELMRISNDLTLLSNPVLFKFRVNGF